MRLNEKTALVSSRIALVPYCDHHVPTYHAWMQDPDLQHATASEPLAIEEEYAMQRSWRDDVDKLTFIICKAESATSLPVSFGELDSINSMVGDINLFLFTEDDDNDHDINGEEITSRATTATVQLIVGEIELMIARKEYRRQGYGRAALQFFFQYILNKQSEIVSEYRRGKAIDSELRLDYLRVKINEHNHASLALFESMGFRKTTEHANYFGELELRASLTSKLFLSSALPGNDSVQELTYDLRKR